ncbi:MAG: hypothetical protein ACPGPE_09700 [Planctomycetota bacterium]
MHTRFLFLLAAGAVTSLTAAARTESVYLESHFGDYFDPGTYVPLSSFETPSSGTIRFVLRSEIVQWAAANGESFEVLFKDGTREPIVSVLDNGLPATINHLTPETQPGVVVCGGLRQVTHLVTHWRKDSAEPKGYQSVGGTSAILVRGLDENGQPSDLRPLHPDKPLTNAAGETYYWNTQQWNLFDDGSGVPEVVDAVVPAYERYIGENYSPRHVHWKLRVYASDRCRARSGFPIAHRNMPDAMPEAAGHPPAAGVLAESGLPLLQMLHGHIVDPEPWANPEQTELYDPVGNEQSLATFVLPPGWSPTPTDRHAVLFSGDYDIHVASFNAIGERMIDAITDLHDGQFAAPSPTCSNSRISTVGLIWNGGGSNATFTYQRSRYQGANELFQNAAGMLGADIESMTFVGGSRSGTCALSIASNPEGFPYTAKVVHARSPYAYIGTGVALLGSPTYYGTFLNFPTVSGFQDSYLADWKSPVGSLVAGNVVLKVLTGYSNPFQANDLRAFSSQTSLDGLLAEGTEVHLRVGTHDPTNAYAFTTLYFESLIAKGIPAKMEVMYRAGHRPPYEGQVPIADLVARAQCADAPPLATALEHFQIQYPPVQPAAPAPLPRKFVPERIPLTIETPPTLGREQSLCIVLVGQPNSTVDVRLTRLTTELESPTVLEFAGEQAPDDGTVVNLPTFTLAPVGSAGLFGYAWTIVPADSLLGAVTGELDQWKLEANLTADGKNVSLGFGDSSTSFLALTVLPFFQLGETHTLLESREGSVVGSWIEERTGGLSEDGRFPPLPSSGE